MIIIVMYESCILAYPFACLYGYVCGLPLCNDHQYYWCEQMWEIETVVIAMEMLQRDGHGRVWAHYGALSWRSYCLDLSFRTSTWLVVFHVILWFRQCWATLFCYGYVGVLCTPSPFLLHSLNI